MENRTYPSSSDNSSFWDDIIVSPLRDSAQSIDLTAVENFENALPESNEIITPPGATGTDVVAVDQGTAVVAEEDNTTAVLDVAAMNASVFRGRKRARRTFCDTTTLTFEKFSEYFYLPSEQAAEELQQGIAPIDHYSLVIKTIENRNRREQTYPSSSDNSSFWDDIIVSPLRDSAQSIDLTAVENFENAPPESNEIITPPGATGTDVVPVDQGTAVVAEEDNTTAVLDVAAMNASVFRGRKRARRTFCDTTTLTFEKFSEYFYLPSEQAAEELQVGREVFKKKCATGTDVVAVDQGTAVVAEEDNTTAVLDVAAMNGSVFRGRKRARRTFCDTTTLTFEKFSEYFYLPSEQAAEELQIRFRHGGFRLGICFRRGGFRLGIRQCSRKGQIPVGYLMTWREFPVDLESTSRLPLPIASPSSDFDDFPMLEYQDLFNSDEEIEDEDDDEGHYFFVSAISASQVSASLPFSIYDHKLELLPLDTYRMMKAANS
nr:hypothetical protein Iba_chr13cCG14930 [Ipomoea batatas]